MKNRIETWEKYRMRITTSPDWSFRVKKSRSSKHSIDEKALAGKSLGSKAIVLESDQKSSRLVGYDRYLQGKQTMGILKYTLFVVAIILMAVLYVLWVR